MRALSTDSSRCLLRPLHLALDPSNSAYDAWRPRFVLSPAVGRDTHAAQMALQLLPHLALIRREYPFDVLLATWAFSEVVAGAIFSRLFGVPLLAKVHGTDVHVQGRFQLRRR